MDINGHTKVTDNTKVTENTNTKTNDINIRKLEKSDYKEFLDLLSQLTVCDSKTITYDNFCKHYDVCNMNDNIHIFVIVNEKNIIGCGTIIIEPKFIHNLSYVGHIEDIVIDNNYRGKGYGKILIDHLCDLGIMKGCYKIILDCSDENVLFYEKCGFKRKGNEMAKYI